MDKLSIYLTEKYKVVIFFILLISGLLRLINIHDNLLDIHSLRQTQTAITIRDFTENGVNLLYYKTPVLGKPFFVPFEFPIFQATAWMFVKLGVENTDVASRLTSIVYFLVSAILLFLLVKLYFKSIPLSLITLLYYCFVPYSLYWSRSSMIESCAVAFSLSYVLCYIKFYESSATTKKWLYLLACIVFGIIAILVKVTTAYVYSILIGLLTIKYVFIDTSNSRDELSVKKLGELILRNSVTLIGFLCCVLLPMFCLSVWVKHCDELKSLSKYSAMFTSTVLHDWNYGTLQQRLTLRLWRSLLSRTIVSFIPLFILFVLFFKQTYLNIRGNIYFTYSIILSIIVLITILTFFNLHLVHNYYQNAFLPVIAIIVGLLLYSFFIPIIIHGKLIIRFAVLVGSLLLVFLQIGYDLKADYITNLDYVSYLYKDRTNVNDFVRGRIANRVASLSKKDDLIVITDNDWTSEILYYADRKGLMMRLDDDIHALRNDGYTLVVSKYPASYVKLFSSINTKKLMVDEDGYSYFAITN